MKLAFAVQVLQPFQQLAQDDGDVLFAEDARLEQVAARPPERYSMTIQSSVPRSQDPSYLVTKGESSEERMEISDYCVRRR